MSLLRSILFLVSTGISLKRKRDDLVFPQNWIHLIKHLPKEVGIWQRSLIRDIRRWNVGRMAMDLGTASLVC
jgi:hypothetical protein